MRHSLSACALATLHARISADPDFTTLQAVDLHALPTTGLAHDHIRLGDSGWLARVPKQSQFGLAALDNLRYQAACFRRASACGHAPRLQRVLLPCTELPLGALIVEYIAGRPLHMPAELARIAPALAALHNLPLPAPAHQPPLRDSADAVASELRTIQAQAAFLPDAALSVDSQAQLDEELHWAQRYAAQTAGQLQPVRLIATDTHPGNWLLRHGQAVLVDWEKGQYSSPAVDLAHASLYTSTTWDVVAAGAPTLAAIAAFYQHWLEAAVPDLANPLRPWLLPLRRLVWLRAVTWCVKWRVASRQARRLEQRSAASTEDWSAERSDAALVAHVQNRVDHYLDPAVMALVRQEWAPGSPLQYL